MVEGRLGHSTSLVIALLVDGELGECPLVHEVPLPAASDPQAGK